MAIAMLSVQFQSLPNCGVFGLKARDFEAIRAVVSAMARGLARIGHGKSSTRPLERHVNPITLKPAG